MMRMGTVKALAAAIRPRDKQKMQAASRHVDDLIKPTNSLGRLESMTIQLSGLSSCAPTMAYLIKAWL